MDAAQGAWEVVTQGEQLKHSKYTNLESKYGFVPMAIESSKAFGSKAQWFFKDHSHWLRQATLDPSSHQSLIHQLLVELQRDNAAAVLGSMGTDVEDLSNGFS